MDKLSNRKFCPNKLFLSTKDINLDKLEPSEITKLDNGLEVSAFFSSSTELVKLDFIFRAGSYRQKKVYEASFTNYLLTEGACGKSAKEIADFLDYRGAYIEKNIEKDTAVITAYFLEKYSEEILPVLCEIIYEPVFMESELEVYREKRKQQYLVSNQKVSFVAQTRFMEMIFGKRHPYGKIGSLEDFDKLSTEDLKAFHDTFYKKQPFHIIASGSINEKFQYLLNKYFGIQRNFEPQVEEQLCKIETDKSKDSFITMPNAVQTAIRIGCVNINSLHEDYPMLMILNTLLGGYFGSRLMKNIREEKGYTYGIYSVLHSFYNSGTFFVSTEVDTNVTELASKEIMHELKRLHTEQIDIEELNLVKNYLVGEFIRNMDGVFELSERYKSLIQLLQSNTFYRQYIEAIVKSAPDCLQVIAEKYLHEDSMSQIYVGMVHNK